MEETAAGATPAGAETRSARQVFAQLRRNVTPRLGAALALWRLEAYTATPLALVLVASLGRWPASFAMGSLMAVYAAVFLFLLDGEPVWRDVHGWAHGRRLGRLAEEIAEGKGLRGALQRVLAVPGAVMLLGPFWRAVTFHLFRVPRGPAYVLSVGGSIPHSLFWTGIVVGGLWEVAGRPLLDSLGL